jgi:chromosome segregation ATPase
MFRVVCLAFLVVASANSDASDQSANPVRKIVTLMQDMQKELTSEHAKEQELYDKFMCFCSTGEEDLKKTSADAAAQIDSLSASLEEMKAEKSGLEEDLEKHKSELAQAEQDLAKAEAVRGKEKESYEEDHANSVQATTALGKAIPALEMSMGGASSASFAQLDGNGALKAALQKSESVTPNEKKMVLAFMESAHTGKTPAGQQIVGILKAMSDEMLKNDATATASEEDSVKGFAELTAAKTGEIEYSKENIEKKNTRVGNLAVAIVQAADGVEDSTAEKANADKFLATLGEQCAAKSKEWDARTKMHTDEVAAISEAIDILNADDALDVFKKTAASFVQKSSNVGPHQYGFLQAGQKTGLMQLQKAERTITAAATFYKNTRISMLLNSMRGMLRNANHHKNRQAVDFTAIVKMIDNMVEVLGKEQKDDEKHKDWCVSEHQKSEDDAATAKSTIESLDAEMANLSDEISTLADDIAALAEGIKTLDKDVATATEQRKTEHAEYLENPQLTEAGIALLGKA